MPPPAAAPEKMSSAAPCLHGPLCQGEDHSSVSNPSRARCTMLDLTWNVDFEARVISGVAVWSVTVPRTEGAGEVIFDCRDLAVEEAKVNGRPTTFTYEPYSEALGDKLTVALPADELSAARVSILNVSLRYATSPSASAAQWLEPSMTAGKARPYLFTQCQAIHARSLVPCQDSPGVKFTYTARVTVPSWATAAMSALHRGGLAGAAGGDGTRTFDFEQPLPVSSYLLALVVGEIESRELSARSRVWAEPSVVEAAAHEFAETEAFLVHAEEITGVEYPWQRYDIVCMPASFPFGGMENPTLTFVTPTLLAGDRSLAGVVAHEIAHSWTGNLITNANWAYFWLNEGWTVWLERKIKSRMAGDAAYYDFLAQIDYPRLRDDVERFARNGTPEYSALVPLLGEVDPDDVFSSVPYEKGSALLYVLEKRVGTPAFEAFARAYIDAFKGTAIDAQDFVDLFGRHFPEQSAAFDWEGWWGPGMPPEDPAYDDALARGAFAGAARLAAGAEGAVEAAAEDWSAWDALQQQVFLEGLSKEAEKAPLPPEALRRLGEALGLARATNSEIRFRWIMLCLGAGMEEAVDAAVDMATSVGRMKFVRPLYRALHATDFGRGAALAAFGEKRAMYHPIAAKMVARDLGVDAE